MRGKFIVIEGLDGSGKSTQAKKLAQALPNSILTREPSDGNIGMLCRATISKQFDLNRAGLMLLLIADRIDHLEKTVKPALEVGKNVICDRYYLSNMAYQAQTGQGVPKAGAFSISEIYELNKQFNAITPDLTIFLSLEPQIALQRIKLRSTDRGIFDDLQTLEEISSNYQKAIMLLTQQGEKIIEISAAQDEGKVAMEILNALV